MLGLNEEYTMSFTAQIEMLAAAAGELRSLGHAGASNRRSRHDQWCPGRRRGVAAACHYQRPHVATYQTASCAAIHEQFRPR